MGVLYTLIRVALGTANVLGLVDIKMKVNPTTAHLMTNGRCIYDCKFCTQARSSKSDKALLSRISWPEFEEDLVLSALRENRSKFNRVCLQVVHSKKYTSYIDHVKNIKMYCQIPLSVDLKAENIESVRETFLAGADCVGLPIDCASPKVYPSVKDGTLSSQLQLIETAASEYPLKISTHIIVGLGESEFDVIVLMKRLKELGVTLGLFAFTPIKGTALADKERPQLSGYRRLQMARYLIFQGFEPKFEFDRMGDIIGFGYSPEELKELIDPSAFQTTGCKDCNRPYYNERPGGVIYNYPHELSLSEYQRALADSFNEKETGCDPQ